MKLIEKLKKNLPELVRVQIDVYTPDRQSVSVDFTYYFKDDPDHPFSKSEFVEESDTARLLDEFEGAYLDTMK